MKENEYPDWWLEKHKRKFISREKHNKEYQHNYYLKVTKLGRDLMREKINK